MTTLGFAPSENPFVVEHGGFYRRWLSMIDDLAELRETVDQLTGTTEDVWVPVWVRVGRRYEERGDDLAARGGADGARRAYLQAKTYYAIGRFPGGITPVKRGVSEDCARAYRKASAFLDPPLEVIEVVHDGRPITCHLRAPVGASPQAPVAAVLVMCGADVFKEDRGWAAEFALDNGMAALVMDAPGTGENPFPWAPESVSAWVAAIAHLQQRPEIAVPRIGAFGISRAGTRCCSWRGRSPIRSRPSWPAPATRSATA